jgi:hypothetical protein
MSDENPEKPVPEKPDPIEDVRKGLGLLFRAAKSALDQLPTRQVEEAVVSGAREVGRAIENVTGAIDKQFFKREPGSPADAQAHSGEAKEGERKEEAKDATPDHAPGGSPPADGAAEKRGPRVE